MAYQILTINPGSTSTKIALFMDDRIIGETTLKHDTDELAAYETIIDQLDFRRDIILKFMDDHDIDLKDIDVFVGRGGMLKPLKKSGAYVIDETMLDDLRNCRFGSHASNLGALLADELAERHNRPAYVVDPVSIDEMEDIARECGMEDIKRTSVFHALNQKATAHLHAKKMNAQYDDLTLIVCHLGGGISIGLHKKGRVVDVNNALGGDGPFSPERTGTIPTFPLVDMCFSGEYTKQDLQRKLVGGGGLVAYLNTSDGLTIEKMIEDGDKKAEFYFDAMAYTVIKEIGSLYMAAAGDVDGVLLTGGLAYSDHFVDFVKQHVESSVKCHVYPGERELEALAEGALRVLNGEEKPRRY